MCFLRIKSSRSATSNSSFVIVGLRYWYLFSMNKHREMKKKKLRLSCRGMGLKYFTTHAVSVKEAQTLPPYLVVIVKYI